jgi:cytochrome P450
MSAATASAPPGPRGAPVIGSTLDFRRDMLSALVQGWRQHGDIVLFRGRVHPFFPCYFFAHPDHVRHILQDNHENYLHPKIISAHWRAVVGDGVVTREGDDWARQRRLAQSAIDPKRIANYDSMIVDQTDRMLQRWRERAADGSPLDIQAEMKHHVFNVLASALMTPDLESEGPAIEDAVAVHVDNLSQRMNAPFEVPDRAPLPGIRRFVGVRDWLTGVVDRKIADRRRADEDLGDMLSMLLLARDEKSDGGGMMDAEARYEVKTFFIAGLETTAITLAWSMYLLSKNPEVAERLRAELDEVLGGRPPTAEDVGRLEYTTMVLKETLRLYPPLWIIMRIADNDDEIGGYRVPAGTAVVITGYITNRHPEFWENPEGFDPDRFSKERSKGRNRAAFLAFGAGPRGCLGFPFAMLEMPLVLARVLQQFDVQLVPGHRVEPEPALSLRQKPGALVTVKPR